MRILLIGPPGVGKGTQAARLQAKTGAVPLASGDIFRAELRNESELGKLAKSYMDKGDLVPDDVTIRMMEGRIHPRRLSEDRSTSFGARQSPRKIGILARESGRPRHRR